MNTKQSDKRITALYARLSRDDEKDGISGSIQNQKVILEKYAKDNHLPNPRFFYDDGVSGVTFTRPAFMEIMELAEQGMVGTIVVKGHFRLGRNRLVVGQLLEEDFVRLDIRYIAIMDNIDTEKGISDIVPMQDLFNEWHAKNTSDKVRRVMQSKGMSGKPLTTNPPFGYMKNPENKDEWIVDEPATKVVRRIFDLCISGLGPTQIAKELKAEKVMTPTEYWNSIDRKCSKPPAVPFGWVADTVSNILDKQEYCGDTVNFRTTSKSFKLKKRLERPKEEWQVFKNTHPAIVDRETFELVQELRMHRRRPTKSGIVSMFSGLLYCADCGEKLYYCTSNSFETRQDHFVCSTSRKKGKEVCDTHFIRAVVLEEGTLQHMRLVIQCVADYEDAFRRALGAKRSEEAKKDLSAKKRTLQKSENRLAELDRLFKRIYEDMVNGKLSEARFQMLSDDYEQEQADLRVKIEMLENEIQNQEDQAENVDRFIRQAKKYLYLEKLTPTILNDMVNAVYVHAPDKSSGHRVQDVTISYNYIGILPANLLYDVMNGKAA